MKPTLVFTVDRRIERTGDEPIRLAITLQAWTTREQADLDTADIQASLTTASAQIAADLFGEITPAAPSCRTCRFWCGIRNDEYGGSARCARHAPAPTPLGDSSLWPVTCPDDNCGDYQRSIVALDGPR